MLKWTCYGEGKHIAYVEQALASIWEWRNERDRLQKSQSYYVIESTSSTYDGLTETYTNNVVYLIFLYAMLAKLHFIYMKCCLPISILWSAMKRPDPISDCGFRSRFIGFRHDFFQYL